jgi:hypothetical protein
MTPNNSTCVKNTCDFSIKLSIKTNVLSVSIYNNTIYPKFTLIVLKIGHWTKQ